VDRAALDAAVFEDRVEAGRVALAAGEHARAAAVLRAALGLWRGPVLADLADYPFVGAEAARLEDLRLAALEARIDADLALGGHAGLTGELDRLVSEHPLRERVHAQRILALYRCGRQADALAAYRRVRELLADELGVDPEEPLQRLHHAVLTHDRALDWRPATPGAGPPVAAVPGRPAEAVAPGVGTAQPGLAAPPARVRRGARVAGGRARASPDAGPWDGAGSGRVGLHRRCGPPVARAPAGAAGEQRRRRRSARRRGGPTRAGGGEPGRGGLRRGSVWAVSTTEGRVCRIDPHSHQRRQTIPVGSAADPTASPSARTRSGWRIAPTAPCPGSTPGPRTWTARCPSGPDP
jgi:hypothetical protein